MGWKIELTDLLLLKTARDKRETVFDRLRSNIFSWLICNERAQMSWIIFQSSLIESRIFDSFHEYSIIIYAYETERLYILQNIFLKTRKAINVSR